VKLVFQLVGNHFLISTIAAYGDISLVKIQLLISKNVIVDIRNSYPGNE